MDKKLEQLINNENTYFIHYASNGFYNGSIITCQRDKGEPVLYKKELKYTDCPYS